jgi:hypothetical protein
MLHIKLSSNLWLITCWHIFFGHLQISAKFVHVFDTFLNKAIKYLIRNIF